MGKVLADESCVRTCVHIPSNPDKNWVSLYVTVILTLGQIDQNDGPRHQGSWRC